MSCSKEDTVQVFDPQTRQLVAELPVAGDRPKALAVSPDGARVYAAIFESGNASTILAPQLTPLDQVPPPSVVADPEGPYHGQDPPPNAGSAFHPPINPYLDSNYISRGSLIVKKNSAGQWMDDNAGDWTEFVSGAKATRSGRIPAWDMPDRDRNTLSEDLPLPGHYGLAANSNAPAPPLPNGNAIHGLQIFLQREFPGVPPNIGDSQRCVSCHDCQSFATIEIQFPVLPRNASFRFRSPSLRSVAEKVGMNSSALESRAGFGFMHDGRTDTLTRFLVDGFGFDDNQDIADMVAFLLSISGGDIYDCAGDSQHVVQDAHVALGRQVTLTSPELTDELASLMELSGNESAYRGFDVVAAGRQNGTNRTWVYSSSAQTGLFDSDRNGQSLFLNQLYPLASPDSPMTFMAVVQDSGRRMGIDRDDDGVFDRTELDQGSNPLDVTSPSDLPPSDEFRVPSQLLIFYAGIRVDQPLDFYGFEFPRHPNRRITFSILDPEHAPPGASIDSTGTRLVWEVPKDDYISSRPWDWGNVRTNVIRLRVTDNAFTEPTEISIELWTIRELRIFMAGSPFLPPGFSPLSWMGAGPFSRYEVQVADSAAGPWRRAGFVHRDSIWLDWNHPTKAPSRLYRVIATQ